MVRVNFVRLSFVRLSLVRLSFARQSFEKDDRGQDERDGPQYKLATRTEMWGLKKGKAAPQVPGAKPRLTAPGPKNPKN